jgi:hypothetical protein
MATKINVRSPFYIKKLRSSGVTTQTLDLKIWTGAITPIPGTVNYSLTKGVTEVPGSGGSFIYSTFEIAELVRDYINIAFDGDYTSYCVWVNDGTDTYLAVDGYGYYEDGINPELSRTKLISNKVIWRPYGENIRIPVYADDTYDVVMASKGTALRTESVTLQNSTTTKIKYISVSGTLSEDNYQQRVLDDSGIYEYNPLLRALNNYVDVNLIDEIRIYPLDADGMTDAPYESIKVRTMHCDRYPDRKVTFVNKLGAFQDVYFFAKEVESINTTSEQYKANMVDLYNVSYSGHQYQSFNQQGRESITLNTGFVSEDYNEVLKQMMLSEKVWLTKTDSESTFVYPVKPRTNSLTYQTSLNDKMVSYTVEFDYAFDKIQNIR